MSKSEVTTQQAKTHLSRYLKRVEEGAEIIIKRGDVAVAKLVAVDLKGSRKKRKRPPVGSIQSEGVSWSDDCFSPLAEDDILDWGL